MSPHQKSKPPPRDQEPRNQLDPTHDNESLTKGGDNHQSKDGVLKSKPLSLTFSGLARDKTTSLSRSLRVLLLFLRKMKLKLSRYDNPHWHIPQWAFTHNHAGADEAPRKTFPFLALPPEVRNKIYRDVALHNDHYVVFLPYTLTFDMMEPLWQPPITRVNRQIRNECLSIMYGECRKKCDLHLEYTCYATHENFLDPFFEVYAALNRFTPSVRTGRSQQSPRIFRVKFGNSYGHESVSTGFLEPRGLRSFSTLRFLTNLEITVGLPKIEERIVALNSASDWGTLRPNTVGFRMCSAFGARHYSAEWLECQGILHSRQGRPSNERLNWEDPATVAEEYSRCIGELEYGLHVLGLRQRYHRPADLPSSGLPIDVDVMCSIARCCPELTNSVWAILEYQERRQSLDARRFFWTTILPSSSSSL